jgi:hypothetical protein
VLHGWRVGRPPVNALMGVNIQLRTLAVLALALHAQVAAAQRSSGPDPLRGLRSVAVSVQGNAKALDSAGVRVKIELQLRQAGIRVSDSASVVLTFRYNLQSFGDGSVNYIVSSEFLVTEWVTQARRPSGAAVWAVTWGGPESFTYATLLNWESQLQKVAQDGLQDFLNDYLAANPPRR